MSVVARELLRRQALTLRRATVLTWTKIAKVCGVSISTVMKWSRWLAGQGKETFVPRGRGSMHGSGRTLTFSQ
ncbi:helix-turn-helix domain-containing protein [Aromatoleum diolicum]|uniref:Transposase n=1 Tax=Aromatoleum diolicum TaxID=75796 RepID=A0ABX1Q9W4_9RHOO|nr:hypothetical protein [Aromatoleum diolicum]